MICKKCKEEREDKFYKNSLICKKCRCEETKEWTRNNKEKVSAARKKLRDENKEEYLEKERKEYQKNNEKRLESARKWRENNREKSRASTKKWQDKNRDKIREYQEKNKDKQKEYHKKYKEKYPEKFAENARNSVAKSRSQHPEKNKARKFLFSVLRNGLMTRPDKCSHCLIPCKPEGHHPDYSKPLDVIWLCKKCHVEEHAK